MEAWIGLGSNQEEPLARLREALKRLEDSPEVELRKVSGYYRSAPWGKTDQNDFLNAVAVLETTHEPRELLDTLLQIESDMGRDRSGQRWGPRCIDLDLLTYENQQIVLTGLEVPHPRMHLRAFVLQPLLELDSGFLIDGIGPAMACLQSLQDQKVEYLGPLL